MQNLAKTHKTLTVVNDQHGCPTWTRTLAEFMTYLTDNQKEYGYYHLSNDSTEDTNLERTSLSRFLKTVMLK